MAKTRPGADRITKQQLRYQLNSYSSIMGLHERDCITCVSAGYNAYMRCAQWWDAARQAHRIRRKLRIYDLPETGNVIPLFTMDE